MKHYTTKAQRCPHLIQTKIKAVELFRQTRDVEYVMRKYHVGRASVYRWNKQYDGTKDSLENKSHNPKTPHPNAHTEQEIKWIKDYHRRNPNITICELYGKLREDKAYSRHPGSLYRVFIRLGFKKKPASAKKRIRHLGEYDTPTKLGEKWQMDVKYVPNACYAGTGGEKFYQYTMIDEASRERFIYPYKEQSGFSTVDFVKRAITYFGYAPRQLQTDNGAEFTNFVKTRRVHILDKFCAENKIEHKLIRPRTPWHNGKVERSHRSDQERFYNYLRFYSYDDLLIQMQRYLRRSNRIPMTVLGWKSPISMRQSLEFAPVQPPEFVPPSFGLRPHCGCTNSRY